MRQGDLYIYMTENGGEMSVRNGEPKTDPGLETAINISIFGHDGTDFWMNEYLSASEQLGGKFIKFLRENPKTVKNINQSEQYLRQDLQWILDDGVADDVQISIGSERQQQIYFTVEIYAFGKMIFKNQFQVNWMAQMNSSVSGRE
jgi:phage gp46-like protein